MVFCVEGIMNDEIKDIKADVKYEVEQIHERIDKLESSSENDHYDNYHEICKLRVSVQYIKHLIAVLMESCDIDIRG